MKNIIVYGIGDNYIHNAKWLDDRYNIVAFADGNIQKVGMYINHKAVIAKEAIDNVKYDEIIVTPNAYLDIIKELVDIGIERKKIVVLKEIVEPDDAGKDLNLVFFFEGGLGDNLISFNYAIYFAKKYKKSSTKIKLYFKQDSSVISSFLKDYELFDDVDELEYDSLNRDNNFDVIFRMRRYPQVMYADKVKVSRLNPELIDYIFACEKYEIFNSRFFASDFQADGMSCFLEIDRGHKRIQQPDIYNILGIQEKFAIESNVDERVLNKYSLNSKQYITIHRGCDKRYFAKKNTKLWNSNNYERLMDLLASSYPDFELVLVGEEYEKTDDIVSCGKNLLGKTNFEELKAVLYHSVLHIDTEGGLVHLRHAVNGGVSVVLFGPTSEDFFGYSENINIRTNACPIPCEWMTLNWTTECINKIEPYICMKSITPESVIEEIEKRWR